MDDAPFSVLDGLDAGLTRSNLRSPRWERSVYGVRMTRRDLTLEERCRMLDVRLAGAVFSHSTAARLHGMPVPLPMERSDLVHIALRSPSRAPHVRGIRGHKIDFEPGDVVQRHGLSLTSPVRTFFDMAPLLRLPQLVAMGDHLIRRDAPLCSRDDIAARLARHAGHRGVRLLRIAFELLSDRSESPPESIFRVIAIVGGLPAPEVNHEIVDSESGTRMRPDFRFSRYRTLVEYQGDYHRTKAQWRKDMTRRGRLEAMGWRVLEINWDDLQSPDELIARLTRLFAL